MKDAHTIDCHGHTATETSDDLVELLSLSMTVDEDGATVYRNMEGLVHRVRGPAVIYPDVGTEWFLHGALHREDGPAISLSDGYKAWFRSDNVHRTDGPAVIYPDGDREWWLDSQELTEDEFNVQVLNWK